MTEPRGEFHEDAEQEHSVETITDEELRKILAELDLYNNFFDYALGSHPSIGPIRDAKKVAGQQLSMMDNSDVPFADPREREIRLEILRNADTEIESADKLLAAIGQAVGRDGAAIIPGEIEHFVRKYRCELDIQLETIGREERVRLKNLLLGIRKAVELLKAKGYSETDLGIRVITHNRDEEPEVLY